MLYDVNTWSVGWLVVKYNSYAAGAPPPFTCDSVLGAVQQEGATRFPRGVKLTNVGLVYLGAGGDPPQHVADLQP